MVGGGRGGGWLGENKADFSGPKKKKLVEGGDEGRGEV